MDCPYHINQEVVCVEPHPSGLIILDHDYIVQETYQCPRCKRWCIGVGPLMPEDVVNTICECGQIEPVHTKQALFSHLHFAPKGKPFSFEEAIELVTNKIKIKV